MDTSILLTLLLVTMDGIGSSSTEGTSSAQPANRTNNISHEARLINDLLSRTDTVGQRLARPVRDVTDSLRISFGLSLVQVIDMDEINQNIVINVWENFNWMNEYLSWDPSDYGGVKKVNLPPNLVWTPDMVLYQNVEAKKELRVEKLILFSDGSIQWVPFAIYKSTCATDMTHFPFDTQQCHFKFGSWSYRGSEVDLAFSKNISAIALDQYLPNVEWEIVNTTARRNSVTYTCCPNDTYIDLTFSLTIARQWKFFFMFMLLPAIILSAMSLMIFWIPPSRPDRTGLGTSVIGSFMLLLILVTQASPPCEEIRFAKYICINMVLLGVSTLFSCSMVNVSLRTLPMPAATRQILLGPLATIVGVTTQHRARHGTAKKLGVSVNSAGGDAACQCQEKRHNHQADWQCAVKVLDRVMFVVYLIVLTVLLILFFPRP